MKKLLSLILVLSFTLMTSYIKASEDKAYQVVKSTAENILSSLSSRKEEIIKDRKILLAIFEENLKTIDFKRFASSIVGKHRKKMSKQQKIDFVEILKNQIFNTYANQIKDKHLKTVDEIEIKISKKVIKLNKYIFEVASTLDYKNKSYKIVYTLFNNMKKNTLKIINLKIEGINFSLNYQKQFNKLMQKHKNNVIKVLEVWDEATRKSERKKNKKDLQLEGAKAE